MKDVPWFTIYTGLVALSSALAGIQGALPPEWSVGVGAAVVVIGGLSKAIYSFGRAFGADWVAPDMSIENAPAVLAYGPDPDDHDTEEPDTGFDVEAAELEDVLAEVA